MKYLNRTLLSVIAATIFIIAPPLPTLAANSNNISTIKKASKQTSWQDKPVVGYVVPAFSAVKRLPNTLPPGDKVSQDINIFTTPGQYEATSFVLAPLESIDSLKLKVSTLKDSNGNVIDSAAVDIRVVKVWYQAGTAWHSYFGDTTQRELVPELLLHDENVVKVDYKRQQNFVRINYPNGNQYIWASAPPWVSGRDFNPFFAKIKDSSSIQPVKLTAGKMKQFWITVKAPKKAKAGKYSGTISLIADGKKIGKFTLTLRVLPFTLPRAKTYYDLNKNFIGFIYSHANMKYNLKRNGGNWDLAVKRVKTVLKNLKNHNIWNGTEIGAPHFLGSKTELKGMSKKSRKIFKKSLELYKQAGFYTPFIAALTGWEVNVAFRNPKPKKEKALLKAFKDRTKRQLEIIHNILGYDPGDVYFWGYDEASPRIVAGMQPLWKALHQLGARVYQTTKPTYKFYVRGASSMDIANLGGSSVGYGREAAFRAHALGNKILMYAGPHTGPENPDFSRRNNGMLLYKMNYDGNGNYKYLSETWNDFGKGTYRGFNLVYPTRTGVIDTIAWEGFRAGLTDIQYATKLKLLAQKAMDLDRTKYGDLIYKAKADLQWLELFSAQKDNLNSMRTEMIYRILELQKSLKGVN